MASSSATTPDTLITLKITLDGVTRRYKLPLRELGVNSLENKLRSFLHIPTATAATIERYSDSAGSYVVLDPANIAVYKQLYRAAKAKLKLKLRVTTHPQPEESSGPKPVTIEDEPEVESKQVVESAPESSVRSEPPSGTVDTVAAPQLPEEFPEFIKQWRARGMPRFHLRRDADNTEVIDFVNQTYTSDPAATMDPLRGSSSLDGSLPSTEQYLFSQTAAKLSFNALMRDTCERGTSSTSVLAPAAVDATQETEESKASEPVSPPALRGVEESKEMEEDKTTAIKRPFTVCCNSCDRAVPNAHFHCSICDDGDFDLCQDCVNRGITCYGEDHWLIKRVMSHGQMMCSTTHIAPKAKRLAPSSKPNTTPVTFPEVSLPTRPAVDRANQAPTWTTAYNARTCNCCVQEFPEKEFVHCTTCDDYDLCKGCFAKEKHGHHPKHGFVPAVKGTVFEQSISARLSPGRNAAHNALCDGCDKYVRGIRHKCLDCPDWDYCSDCVQNAHFVHPDHRFVAIYEPLPDRVIGAASRAVHHGICCDGPLCPSGGNNYIVGVRYKCAVCHDTDFCANCEASPANNHNKTHPLIKFKTPVRHVSVTTTGEHEDGQRLPAMGDRVPRQRPTPRSTERTPSPRESIAATPVQTVVDVQPTEQQAVEEKKEEVEVKKETIDSEVTTLVEPQQPQAPVPADLVAIFKHDTVADGTVLPPNHTFEQTWVLRNEGTIPWPAGCSVKFVGGDYMGAVDPTHPAGIHELVSASESTICYNALNPGQEFPFTVLMRTPDRSGKVISYWRLTTRDGVKFGHKLWCDVAVKAPLPKIVKPSEPEPIKTEAPAAVPEMTESQMIIPKLEHESPTASIHESRPEVETQPDTNSLAPRSDVHEDDDFEDCGEEDWAAESDEGFMTDEEYDILDASDEEYLFEQQKLLHKK
ncbi:hypothetical protein F4775DRAFT_440408 [Biscogniauxia sp. FL1348]|nr:hypothetical protein F4775DRAFT_440408 [Biscogniauxia sp. FL1348]